MMLLAARAHTRSGAVCARALRPCYILKQRQFTFAATLTKPIEPNAPLQLDEGLKDLLGDADMSLLAYRTSRHQAKQLRELEILEKDESYADPLSQGHSDDLEYHDEPPSSLRKSVEADFGSQRIGSVFLPTELIAAIERLINEHDKHTLHNDAKRLFSEDVSEDVIKWNTQSDARYKSRKQASRHSERDGTAFATVALPAHYAAVHAVLENIKHRLGDSLRVENVMEWGSAVGSAIWASLHSFQLPHGDTLPRELRLSQSTLKSYVAVDKRDGLTKMSKRLLQGLDLGPTKLRWQRAFTDADKFNRAEGHDVLALSAFQLSSLPTTAARIELIKEMWQSGAHTIVLLDHDSPQGFACIAEARAHLLRMGRREVEDPSTKGNSDSGSHVIAPCPHDGDCPLHHPGTSSLRCSFSQRLQRPAFLRKTKHVRAGHEDIGYSYVVVRRGRRPTPAPIFEGAETLSAPNSTATTTVDHSMRSHEGCQEEKGNPPPDTSDPNDRMRLSAYAWPRLVFPPLKKSGHIILDCCTSKGKIMRLTIPRSQGRQPYYDARKSSWGDIFPHAPKNPPQVRHHSSDGKVTLGGSDIGKRKRRSHKNEEQSYDTLSQSIQETKKKRRKEKNVARDEW